MFSFSKQHRLVTEQDFQGVFANPRKIARKCFLALYQHNQLAEARLGIIAGKRHLKHAVDRNKLRRFIRESFRQRKEALKGLDVIIVVRSECTPLSRKALRDNIDNLWQALISSLQSH